MAARYCSILIPIFNFDCQNRSSDKVDRRSDKFKEKEIEKVRVKKKEIRKKESKKKERNDKK